MHPVAAATSAGDAEPHHHQHENEQPDEQHPHESETDGEGNASALQLAGEHTVATNRPMECQRPQREGRAPARSLLS